MVLLLRDPGMEKVEILAAMEAMKASFSAYHNELRKCLSDFESRLRAHITSFSQPPPTEPSPLLPIFSATAAVSPSLLTNPDLPTNPCPYTPTHQSLPAGIATALRPKSSPPVQPAFCYSSPVQPSLSSLSADSPPAAAISLHLCSVADLQKLQPLFTPVTPATEYSSTGQSVSAPKMLHHHWATLSPTPTSEPLLYLPDSLTKNSPPIPTDNLLFPLKLHITQIPHISPKNSQIPEINLYMDFHQPLISTPALRFPVLAHPSGLLISRSWTEEPPGSRFREFTVPLKFLLVDRTTSVIPFSSELRRAISSFSCFFDAALSANATLANNNIYNGLIGFEILPTVGSHNSFGRIPFLTKMDLLSSSIQRSRTILSNNPTSLSEMSGYDSFSLKSRITPSRSESLLNAMELQIAGGASGEEKDGVQVVCSKENALFFCGTMPLDLITSLKYCLAAPLVKCSGFASYFCIGIGFISIQKFVFGVCLVITGMVPCQYLGEDAPLVEVFMVKGLKHVSILISFSVVAGLTTTRLAGFYVMSHLYLGLGINGLQPVIVAKVHPTQHTLVHFQIWFGVVAIIFSGFLTEEVLSHILSIGTLTAYSVISAWVVTLCWPDKSSTIVSKRIISRGEGITWICTISICDFAAGVLYHYDASFIFITLAVVVFVVSVAYVYLPQVYTAPSAALRRIGEICSVGTDYNRHLYISQGCLLHGIPIVMVKIGVPTLRPLFDLLVQHVALKYASLQATHLLQ